MVEFKYQNKLLVVIIAVALFVIIHYVVKSSDDINLIDTVIDHSLASCESEDFLEDMESYKNKYMKSRFKTYMIRGIIFGGLLGGALYMLKDGSSDNSDTPEVKNSAPTIQNAPPKMIPVLIPNNGGRLGLKADVF